MESKVKGPDMPEFISALDRTVALLRQLKTEIPTREQVDTALGAHINMLIMHNNMSFQHLISKIDTRARVDALKNYAQDLFGEGSDLSKHGEGMLHCCPDNTEIHFNELRSVERQIGKLELIKQKFLLEEKIDEVVKQEVDILREFTILFPQGAPFRNILDERINLLK